MTVKQEIYKIKIHGRRPDPVSAAAKMAKYIVDRWMPGHAGGVHLLVTPNLAKDILHLFKRDHDTLVNVDTRSGTVEVVEVR